MKEASDCGKLLRGQHRLSSYTKQAGDDTLMKMATRIKARAARRSGELLRQIEANDKGGRPRNDTAADTVTRTSAARDAGMSKRQADTAKRIAAAAATIF